MPVSTIGWKNGKIRYIDQTLLPGKVRFVTCADTRRLWRAIKRLEIRGAPAIGVAGALGVALAATRSRARTHTAFLKEIDGTMRYLASSRPTAVNLFWALDRMGRVARQHRAKDLGAIKRLLVREALAVLNEDRRTCRAMARHGARLVRTGDTILTHCNAGGLATADYGTALGVLFEAKRQGKRIRVYADETRPLLQGSRLTAWELMRAGIPTTVICDNMAATLMAQGKIDGIFVGADRIASNGDTANKIGTYGLAVLAKHHGIPFYIVAPCSTFDFSLRSGRAIPIEERDADEVRAIGGRYIAPRKVAVYNPAFDVTPHGLITAIVTERGVVRRPSSRTLAAVRRVCR